MIEPNEEPKNQLSDFKRKISIKQTFAALKYPNYRLWFWGQMTSLFGSWMQSTAQAFLIFELTHSPAFLGYVGFSAGIPAWLFTFYGGVIADRFPRRNILMLTQIWMMSLAFILALLAFTNLVQPWHVILLSFGLGVGTAFDSPARHAFVNELVEKEDLINAIALNSTMFNTATALGPAISGIIYALMGPAWCFTLNGISFLAVIYNLWRMKLKAFVPKENPKSTLAELKEGFVYLKTQKMIMLIIFMIALVSIFAFGMITLFPAWAVNILHGDATTNGFLQSARGVGALVAALTIATVSKYLIKGKILMYCYLALPLLITIFSFNRSLFLSLFLLVIIGGILIAIFNLSNATIQTLVAEEFRGRVMSIYSFSFFAIVPLGSLLIGTEAEHLGVPTAILINGIVLFVFMLILNSRFPNFKKIG